MKIARILFLAAVVVAVTTSGSGNRVMAQNLAKDYPVQPVPFTAVRVPAPLPVPGCSVIVDPWFYAP